MLLSDRLAALFPRSYSYAFAQIGDEDLAVSDLSGAGAFYDGFDGLIDELLVHRNLDSDLLEKIDFELHASVALMIALLLAATECVCHRHLEDFIFVQRFFYILQLVRLNIRHY